VVSEYVVKVELQFVVRVGLHLLSDLEVEPAVRLARQQDMHYVFTRQQFFRRGFREQKV
jgi:hypothetical protein